MGYMEGNPKWLAGKIPRRNDGGSVAGGSFQLAMFDERRVSLLFETRFSVEPNYMCVLFLFLVLVEEQIL